MNSLGRATTADVAADPDDVVPGKALFVSCSSSSSYLHPTPGSGSASRLYCQVAAKAATVHD